MSGALKLGRVSGSLSSLVVDDAEAYVQIERPHTRRGLIKFGFVVFAAVIRVVILDIEGTTTPISFVADVLFPFVRTKLRAHLDENWGSDQLVSDIAALRNLAAEDIKSGSANAVAIPQDSEGSKDAIIAAVVKNVLAQMDIDRKTTALKQLQGHIWDAGYKSGELRGVYEACPHSINDSKFTSAV